MLSYLYSPCLCLGHFCVPIGTVCLDCTQWRARLVSPLNIKHKCGCKRELEAIVFCARRSGQKKKKNQVSGEPKNNNEFLYCCKLRQEYICNLYFPYHALICVIVMALT